MTTCCVKDQIKKLYIFAFRANEVFAMIHKCIFNLKATNSFTALAAQQRCEGIYKSHIFSKADEGGCRRQQVGVSVEYGTL